MLILSYEWASPWLHYPTKRGQTTPAAATESFNAGKSEKFNLSSGEKIILMKFNKHSESASDPLRGWHNDVNICQNVVLFRFFPGTSDNLIARAVDDLKSDS